MGIHLRKISAEETTRLKNPVAWSGLLTRSACAANFAECMQVFGLRTSAESTIG